MNVEFFLKNVFRKQRNMAINFKLKFSIKLCSKVIKFIKMNKFEKVL